MEWNKLKRARGCLSCGRAFGDGEGYHSLLFWEDGEMAREDYCDGCAGPPHGRERRRFLSQWQGRYRVEPEKPKQELIAKSVVERLLRKYIDSDDPAHVNVLYIICLMMERKKKLVSRDSMTDPESSKRLIVYEMPKTGETFLVEDPGLRLSQAREVQKQVRALLEKEDV